MVQYFKNKAALERYAKQYDMTIQMHSFKEGLLKWTTYKKQKPHRRQEKFYLNEF